MHSKYLGTWAHFLISLTLLQIFATLLPVTTSSSERSFSALKFIKNYELLNGLAPLLHQDITLDNDAVIDEFWKSSRRL